MKIKNLISTYVMSKLLNSDKKSAKVNNEQILLQNNSDDYNMDYKSAINTEKKLGKNTWLHTTDSFGKMEKGKVL